MSRSRPRRAYRPPTTVRLGRVAVPALLVGLATTGVVTAAAGSGSPQTVAVPAVQSAAVAAPSPTTTAVRDQSTSRGAGDLRPVLTPSASTPKAKATGKAPQKKAPKKKAPKKEAPKKKVAEPKPPSLTVVDHRYTRVDLNVRAEDDADSRLLTVLDSGARLAVTATVRGAWRYISYRGDGAWVKNQYLTQDRPKPATTGSGGISGAACAGGSAVESGLTPDAVRVHRAICARYPAVKAYGGVRADSLPEHPSGRALDAMISDSGVGWQIARWVRANARTLGVSEVLYAQHIWTVQRSGEGWRTFADRGSATANHDDHVHVTVYGNAGG